MTTYQVRYCFDSGVRGETGEYVTEVVASDTPQAVAKRVQEFLSQRSFVITASFGPAAAGFTVIHASHVRYVEIVALTTPGAVATGFAV